MEKEQMIKQILEIFKEVLDVDDIELTETTTSDEIDEWDSLTHIQLIVAIENYFHVRFLTTEISAWKDVGEMMACIQDKLVDKSKNSEEKELYSKESNLVEKTLEYDENVPTYKRNYIHSFDKLRHGDNCFVAEGVSLKNVNLGDRVWINKHATIYSNHSNVNIGSDCYIGPYVWIEGHAGIEIGNSVHIAGPGTNLYTHSGMKMALNGVVLGNPEFSPKDKLKHYFRVPIRIGNNVWIGPNCSISPGVVIQDNVVVMPNTIVKSGVIESYSIVQGNGIIEKNAEFVKSLITKEE